MDLTKLSHTELIELYSQQEQIRISSIKFRNEITEELSKREKFEKLKIQFSGLSEEDFEAVKNALFLSPQSIETEEKSKI